MYKLFIDESGKNTIKSIDINLPFFSLSGVIVHSNAAEMLGRKADQIKFKYWGRTDIVFRASSLRRLTDDFSIFRNSKKFTLDDFYADFLKFIDVAQIHAIWVGMNKLNYINSNPPIKNALLEISKPTHGENWDKMISGIERGIIKNFTTDLLTEYLKYLIKKKDRGQVIMEASDMYQDLGIMSAYNELLVRGHSSLNLNSPKVREHLTSISFVTKKNQDIESQLADMFAHYLNLGARTDDGVNPIKPGSYEEKIVDAFKRKLLPKGYLKQA